MIQFNNGPLSRATTLLDDGEPGDLATYEQVQNLVDRGDCIRVEYDLTESLPLAGTQFTWSVPGRRADTDQSLFYTLETSLDGKVYSVQAHNTLSSRTANDRHMKSGTQADTFTAVARYVRLTISAGKGGKAPGSLRLSDFRPRLP